MNNILNEVLRGFQTPSVYEQSLFATFKPTWNLGKIKFNHSPYLPKDTIRMLVIGSSGSGKSFLVLRMLLEEIFLDYNHLHLCTPRIAQKEYQLLIHAFKNKFKK